MRARQVLGRDDVEQDKGLFFVFVQEEQQQAGDEVEGLAVADSGVVEGEGLEDAAEGTDDGWFGGCGVGGGLAMLVVVCGLVPLGMMRMRRVGLEADVIRESAVEVSFELLAVGIAEHAFVCLLHEVPVQVWFLDELCGAAGVPEPCGAAPIGRDAFADVALDLVALGWESVGILGEEAMMLHERMPFLATAFQILGIAFVPGVILFDGDVLACLFEAVTVSRCRDKLLNFYRSRG